MIDIVSAEAGSDATVLLDSTREVYVTGSNSKGQLGMTGGTNVPTKIPNRSNIVDITAGDQFMMLLDADGVLYSTGLNESGQLGIGNKNNANALTANATMQAEGVKVINLSAGTGYSVISDENGNVYGFGDYSHGLDLDFNETNSEVPVKIGERKQLLTEYEITLKVGESYTIKNFSGRDFNLYQNQQDVDTVSFRSRNENIASMNRNVVTGEAEGITQVIVTKGDLTSILMVQIGRASCRERV